LYKYILLLSLILGTTACTGVSKVKERYHRAPFENEIKKGDYDLTLYGIDYPKEYEKKVEFYNDFEIFMEDLLNSDSAINIMYSQKFKDDIIYLGEKNIFLEEIVFSKTASGLSEVDRDSIDKKVKIKLDEKLGMTQYYLNKQVYFWKALVNDDKKFNSEINYTELDKEKLILQIKESRKKMFEIAKKVELNMILNVEDPYFNNENEYWQEKDVYIDSDTKLISKIFKEQG